MAPVFITLADILILSTYYMPNTELGSEAAVVTLTGKMLPSHNIQPSGKRQTLNK